MFKLSIKSISIFFAFSFLLFLFTIVWILFNLNGDSRLYLVPSPSTLIDDNHHHHHHHQHHKLAVIVPFRERFNQLLQFIPHMDSFLNRQNISHQFFVINQVDDYRFNRGALINVGFLLAKNSSDYIAMHDVDLLPLNDQLSYKFPLKGPFHVSAPNLHPKYHYSTYVGGILLLTNEHFELVNGFSTNYFGWGLEDDEFYRRLKESNLKIFRPENMTTNRLNTFVHLHDSKYKRDTVKLFNQKEVTRKRDRKTGLRTTKYQLITTHNITLEEVSFQIFDVALHCDLNRTPWCQRHISSTLTKTTAAAAAAAIKSDGKKQVGGKI